MSGGWSSEVATGLRALASPLTVGSLVVLALNDHVLKQAWPSVVTGKLSDVTGLVVAPVLLALALAVLCVPRALPVAVLATGVGFTWVKTTYVGAELASAAWTHVWGTSVVLRDPTDLVALPGLAVAWRVWVLARRERSTPRRRAAVAAGGLVLPFAIVATAATSCEPDTGVQDLELVERSVPGQGQGTRMVKVTERWEDYLVTVDATVHPLEDRGESQLGRFGWGPVRRACAQDGTSCWRIEGTARVAASSDGGSTWSDDLVLSEEARERALDEGHDGGCGEDPTADLEGLILLEQSDEILVVVAGQHGGIWLGGPDREWRRTSALLDEGSPLPGRRPDYRLLRPEPPYPAERPERRRPDPFPRGPDVSRPDPRPSPQPRCESPSTATVTPHPSNGPPTSYEVCP